MNNESKKLKLTFCGGAGIVTGSNFLLESENKKLLIDCGLFQGSSVVDKENWDPFVYDPASIDALIITHAHIDHIGRIPKLVYEGFRGKIYSTAPTKDIALIMLQDAVRILRRDKKHNLDRMYTKESIEKAMNAWQTISYHQTFSLGEGFDVALKDAGHILGSAMVEIIYNGKKIVFTGDLGNSPSPLLRDCETITDAHYLVIESVYGDRNHEGRDKRKQILEDVIEANYKNKGALVIPTFSLERSQELLFEINDLVENNHIPLMPFFFDSPLAIRLTDVYKKYQDYFNEGAKSLISSGDDIFIFPGLRSTPTTEESKRILGYPNPKIIIAGSGMSSGGRVVHHEKNYLPDPHSTLLLTGYQSLGTRGRVIQDGAKIVRILGKDVPVRANIVTISGYSGHKDLNHLFNFVQDTSDTVKKVFVVMGEPKSSLFFTQRLRDYLGLDAYAPKLGESVELEM